MKSISQLGSSFPIQSYYDDVLLRYAILSQTAGNPIVDTGKRVAQTPGVGVYLHPASQSPVAIKFKGGDADSAVIHLVPGQKARVGSFDEFEWGLPFGWLGGGNVILYVFHTKEADVEFPNSDSPILFHRQRIAVVNAPVAAAAAIPNWPAAFPWSKANRSVAGALTPQSAAPLIPISSEYVMLQYRGVVAANTSVDLVVQITNADEFDQNSVGPPPTYADGIHYWPITFQGLSGGATAAAVAWLPPEVANLAGDNCTVDIFDPAGGLGGQFVDVARYGRFM